MYTGRDGFQIKTSFERKPLCKFKFQSISRLRTTFLLSRGLYFFSIRTQQTSWTTYTTTCYLANEQSAFRTGFPNRRRDSSEEHRAQGTPSIVQLNHLKKETFVLISLRILSSDMGFSTMWTSKSFSYEPILTTIFYATVAWVKQTAKQ